MPQLGQLLVGIGQTDSDGEALDLMASAVLEFAPEFVHGSLRIDLDLHLLVFESSTGRRGANGVVLVHAVVVGKKELSEHCNGCIRVGDGKKMRT